MPDLHIILLLLSLAALIIAGNRVINSLVKISRYFGLKEFVVAFFTVSIGAVAPEFFVGVSSALKGVPEIALGNVIGENIFLLTITVALATMFSRTGLVVESRTVRGGILFTVGASLLPLILILDGVLSRVDGILLIICFLLFLGWLFSKKERFLKIYEKEERKETPQHRKEVLGHVLTIVVGMIVVIMTAEILISSVVLLSQAWGTSLTILGLFVVAVGTALPETYFAITLARKGQSWMVLGGIMGGVAIASTLVLGTVALISPITVEDVSILVLARLFLAVAAGVFLMAVTTSRRITKKEGAVLLLIYTTFLFTYIVSTSIVQ